MLRTDTTRVETTLHDWATTLTPTSGGPRSKGGHSDPTATTAGNRPPLSMAHEEWQTTLGHLAQLVGNNIPTGLDTLANHIDNKRLRDNQPTIQRVLRHTRTLWALRDQATPITPEQARKELRQKAHDTHRSSDCEACGSPTGPAIQEGWPDTTLVSGLCRPGCYETEKKQVQRGVYTGRTSFIANIKAGVERGEIYRPASPHWLTATIDLHEVTNA